MANALTSEERKILLGIARNVIETYVRSGKIPLEKRDEAALNVQQGCFVTIHRQGRLRGCIGVFTSRMPLWKQVTEMAIAASTRDPRFPAMTEEELADFSLEISVLSPLVKTADPNSVVVGTHGIYLENGLRRGVLLPQVATEYGWNRETFLKQTCRKAGLPTDAWQKPETTIYLFTAEVFGEAGVRGKNNLVGKAMKTFDDLLQQTRFDRDDLKRLLNARETEAEKLRQRALAVKFAYLDNHVHLRGLVELSNICRKDCLYCGLRRSNTAVARYTVSDEEVLDCARLAMELGYGSMAIQCGERSDRAFTDRVTRLVREIKRLSDNSIGITLSCGEQSENVYREWFEAGAHRYLLRIESSDKSLYEKIHPQDETHNFERRLACIDSLLKTGYQTGTGVMVGLPFQTLDHLVHDLLFFQKKDVAMVGLGPFLPHPDTPLWAFREQIPSPEERMRLTLNMISTLRLMMPEINMVAATATQTLDPQGREKAIEAGANVIMPNLTPQQYREEYLIYPDKACVGDRPEQCRGCLELRMKSIGHEILYNAWGDSVAFTKRAVRQDA